MDGDRPVDLEPKQEVDEEQTRAQREETLQLVLANSAVAAPDEGEDDAAGPYSPGSPSRNRTITHLDSMLAKELRLKKAEKGELPEDEDAYGHLTQKLDREFARFRPLK